MREVADQKIIAGEPMLTTALVRDMKTITVERVEHVPPVDEDDDGIADAEDDCVFCEPEPVYASTASCTRAATRETGRSSSPIDGYYGAGGAIRPTSRIARAGETTARSILSGAYGAYQIIPSTAAAYGCDLSTPAGQDPAPPRYTRTWARAPGTAASPKIIESPRPLPLVGPGAFCVLASRIDVRRRASRRRRASAWR